MKVLVVTGGRADRNGLEVVHQALRKAGHESELETAENVINMGWFEGPEVAIVGGDRSEILQAAVKLAIERMPIAHIAGGDITLGSADDRYRDAITALSCIHFATNKAAYERLTGEGSGSVPLVHPGDDVCMTGSPAIDRIKQTPVYDKRDTVMRLWHFLGGQTLSVDRPTALVCVHPNTVGREPMTEAWAGCAALSKLEIQCVCLGANADVGGEAINAMWRDWCTKPAGRVFVENVSPRLYYSLMTHCNVMVGNSSAMLYEAPCFGLPCVLVGDRQYGRIIPGNVAIAKSNADIAPLIKHIVKRGLRPEANFMNPYGDGNSAPRIVKALEENAWRWTPKSTLKPIEARHLSSP